MYVAILSSIFDYIAADNVTHQRICKSDIMCIALCEEPINHITLSR